MSVVSVSSVRALSARWGTSATAPATPRARLKLIGVLGLLVALQPFTFDLYLPALPALTRSLSTTDAQVQLTLTGTLLGAGAGQLVVGALSDRFGRRRPLLAGIAVHIVASVLCALAPTVEVLGVLRVLQGFGAASAAVTAMAVVRDLYTGSAAAAMISRLILVVGVSPVLAPSVGAALLRTTDWRGIFVTLALLGSALGLLSGLVLRETLPVGRRHSGGMRDTAGAYRILARDRAFLGLTTIAAASMGVVFAYVSGSTFVLQDQYGLSEQQFGLVFAVNAIALIGTPQLNVVLLRRWSPEQLLGASLAYAVVLAVALLAVTATGFGGLPVLLVVLFLTLVSCGLVGPNTGAMALSRHGESAGTAASVLGTLQSLSGAVMAPLVGLLGNDALAMGAVISGLLGTAAAVHLLVVRPQQALEAPRSYADLPVVVGH
ncbi:DHA1 family bicyclomycin/chloramphenicol resistance-like MFS transporter [Motilibacter rhizosphaerae]|uniref:DHA1 family bicyclomycin/chloramphenicol resistance-like MFS transporter n=1 Tax=Motilibacter rhizosphaerae TaxID=598652 RepID=A0A4Q7NQG9_9ACTN|nr:multidrug effflux MFS transporter [Motilibacter rhizosphaerae]RZS86830.1 DHA1 family bicyclomycin/chloramphenicol resistance-like MFS transporter [Motilibacter rhizosphaerae]